MSASGHGPSSPETETMVGKGSGAGLRPLAEGGTEVFAHGLLRSHRLGCTLNQMHEPEATATACLVRTP